MNFWCVSNRESENPLTSILSVFQKLTESWYYWFIRTVLCVYHTWVELHSSQHFADELGLFFLLIFWYFFPIKSLQHVWNFLWIQMLLCAPRELFDQMTFKMNKNKYSREKKKSFINLCRQRLQLEITFNSVTQNAVEISLLTKRSTEKHICV